jgi:PAS domain S-box-containing protein
MKNEKDLAAPPQTVVRGDDLGQPSATEELAALRAIVEGTARHTGQEFFQSLVQHLALAVQTRYAFVAVFVGEGRVRTLAYWLRDRIVDNVEWDLVGTPCEDVVRGNLCHHPSGVSQRFPDDKPLVDWGIESYLGVPLCDTNGEHLGHLAVFDERSMPAEPRRLFTFRIFADRAAAELDRLRFQRQLRESEERYRDLYEEAPIGYIQEDLESQFIAANRAALGILGLASAGVPGTIGMSFVANTPDAQQCYREAFRLLRRGTATGGFILEMHRQDNGRPVWVQWWSRPDPNGLFTRTMFVDVTERVLMEQEKARLHQENLYLQEEIKAVHNFEEIIGQSQPLLAVLENIRRVSPTDASVLISGETGTGKELIARAIHSSSKRKDKPLIKINCAALPTGLVESELFGHEKGAFTGAIARRLGRFELANGGTIFLDEIGEIPAEVQAKLLRVLQEREFDRVGGSTPIKVDVRVIAATNRNLLKAVRDKTFREDLYYRLSVFPITLPPLRERNNDIPLLVGFLIDKFKTRIGKQVDGVGRSTMQRLLAYSWPGNVRELENVLERAVILASSPILEIDPDHLSASSSSTSAEPQPGSLESVERAHIRVVLEQTGWVIEGPKGAAKVLELHPNTLRSRLKKLGITRAPHDPS